MVKKNYGTTVLLQAPNDLTADLPDLPILENLINLNAVSIHGPGESSKKKKHKTNKKNTNKTNTSQQILHISVFFECFVSVASVLCVLWFGIGVFIKLVRCFGVWVICVADIGVVTRFSRPLS